MSQKKITRIENNQTVKIELVATLGKSGEVVRIDGGHTAKSPGDFVGVLSTYFAGVLAEAASKLYPPNKDEDAVRFIEVMTATFGEAANALATQMLDKRRELEKKEMN